MKIQLVDKFQYVDISGNIVEETKLNGTSFCFARDAKQTAVLGAKKNISKKLPFSSTANNDYFTTYVDGKLVQLWLFNGDSCRWANTNQQTELNGKWFIKI